MKRLSVILCVLAGLSVSGAVAAHSYKQGDISIGHVWTRATMSGVSTAAIYLPLLNTGKEPDKLLGATSALADKIDIRDEKKENGIASMPKLDALTLEPGKPVALRPGGMHLMVFGLKKQLKVGEMFPLTLQFEKAGNANVEAKIEDIGASNKP